MKERKKERRKEGKKGRKEGRKKEKKKKKKEGKKEERKKRRKKEKKERKKERTSQVVQWLRLHAPNAAGLGLIPGQGTRSCMLQLRVHMPQLKIPNATTKKILHATTKTWHSQINK